MIYSTIGRNSVTRIVLFLFIMAILNVEDGEDIAMKINQLIANNINKLDTELPVDKSLGIAGLSGSGKTTFCQTIGEESKKLLFLYCQRLNISIYFLTLWKQISVPSRWKKCL